MDVVARYAGRYGWAKWLFLLILALVVAALIYTANHRKDGLDAHFWRLALGGAAPAVTAVVIAFRYPHPVIVRHETVTVAVSFAEVRRIPLAQLIGIQSNRDNVILEANEAEPVNISRNRLSDIAMAQLEFDCREYLISGTWPSQVPAA